MVDVVEITKELKEKGYTLIPRLAGNDARLKEENLRWRVTSNHIDWDWDFKTLEEVQAFCAKEKEIFRTFHFNITIETIFHLIKIFNIINIQSYSPYK